MFDQNKYNKDYYKQNKEKNRGYRRSLNKKYKKKESYKIYQRLYCKTWRSKLKQEVISHYGGECECCGENELIFLCIDHIHGGGLKHRREIQIGGNSFYVWLKKNNYPKGFRVLCWNCNAAYGFLGYCPHKQDKNNKIKGATLMNIKEKKSMGRSVMAELSKHEKNVKVKVEYMGINHVAQGDYYNIMLAVEATGKTPKGELNMTKDVSIAVSFGDIQVKEEAPKETAKKKARAKKGYTHDEAIEASKETEE
jgi:hypothetical protein